MKIKKSLLFAVGLLVALVFIFSSLLVFVQSEASYSELIQDGYGSCMQ